MNDVNPYQPPQPHNADNTKTAQAFISAGRTVDAGRGWDWIVSGFDLFKKQAGMWVLLGFVFMVCMILINVVPVLGGVAGMLLFPIFGAGFMLACRDAENDQTIEIGHLFAGFKRNTGDLVVVGVLTVVAAIVIIVPVMLLVGGAGFFAGMHGGVQGIAAMGLTVVLGVLVVMALSVPISMALWFAPALVVFHDLKPVEALKTSFFACLKNVVPFLLYAIVLLVLGVFASIPFGLGWLVLIPVALASVYMAYREIFFDG
jgi:hypothetical protein